MIGHHVTSKQRGVQFCLCYGLGGFSRGRVFGIGGVGFCLFKISDSITLGVRDLRASVNC